MFVVHFNKTLNSQSRKKALKKIQSQVLIVFFLVLLQTNSNLVKLKLYVNILVLRKTNYKYK